jgi:hypothetical protein
VIGQLKTRRPPWRWVPQRERLVGPMMRSSSLKVGRLPDLGSGGDEDPLAKPAG